MRTGNGGVLLKPVFQQLSLPRALLFVAPRLQIWLASYPTPHKTEHLFAQDQNAERPQR
jgi:hypothetical protein